MILRDQVGPALHYDAHHPQQYWARTALHLAVVPNSCQEDQLGGAAASAIIFLITAEFSPLKPLTRLVMEAARTALVVDVLAAMAALVASVMEVTAAT